MDWDTLFSMQKELDDYIEDKHQLQETDTFEERFLALLVELGELANETRCFKYWSTKEKSGKTTILEEYVDNIHFLLSIGLHKGYKFSQIDFSITYLNETMGFNHVFEKCLDFYKHQTEENYLNMFREYLHLAKLLGFAEKDIMEAYHKKNEVNYERQEKGY
ncbi:dUTP diphosphatase [Pseudogracilibacillus auburnensis]|uniref:Dimeric dUTPase (All-alpha-NTP-PPase superfamily) n=1 Tax=Pseudogracilibacillus auburnensis TaxID=1494959 RepID=A0A2V3VTN8_9BACI|nr:dUTP diphosphatase [Pseudogracilibacillus auburnensis]PXW85273.1 dimeric dUTPase (all-alpha-NTP-PPase superfamily) [Pseudogracilibacillus auburnensis]